MKTIFFTPGPAQLYPTTISHFQNGFQENIASISHRSKRFEEIYEEVKTGLKKLLTIPDDYHIFFVGSGTEAMERTIQNCVQAHSFHFVNGSFSERFFVTAEELGKRPQKIESEFGQGFNFTNITIPRETELICFTHNETSSGVMLPVEQINRISKEDKEKLIAVDIVSSVPYVNLNYALLDVVFFSVQKGFGLPAGLGLMVVSPRAIKKAKTLSEKGITIGSYHSFQSFLKFEEKNQNPETPPVLEMYVLGKVIQDMLQVGIENIRKQTEEKAKRIYDFLDNHKEFSAFVQDQKFRSQTIIVANVGSRQKEIMAKLAAKGLLVGTGYGIKKDTQIRIANLPAHSTSDIEFLLKHFI